MLDRPGQHVPRRSLWLVAVQRNRPRVHDGEHLAAGVPGGDQLALAVQPDPLSVGSATVEVDADEIGDVPGAGPFAQLGERSRLHYPAGLEDDHAIAKGHGVDGVVRDDDPDAVVCLEVAAQLPAGVDARARIERGQRLVEQEHAWLRHERPGERYPLGLASAQRARPRRRVLGHVDAFEPRPGAAAGVLPPNSSGPQTERHVLQRAEMREQRLVLEHETDRATIGRRPRATHRVVEHASVDRDPSAVERQQPGERAQQRRLAGAVRPDQHDRLAGLGIEPDVEGERAEPDADAGL